MPDGSNSGLRTELHCLISRYGENSTPATRKTKKEELHDIWVLRELNPRHALSELTQAKVLSVLFRTTCELPTILNQPEMPDVCKDYWVRLETRDFDEAQAITDGLKFIASGGTLPEEKTDLDVWIMGLEGIEPPPQTLNWPEMPDVCKDSWVWQKCGGDTLPEEKTGGGRWDLRESNPRRALS
ncbi:hypothetical protein B0H16DRAFT_1469705 [Mycena metata]|uniref:Uncharacterized protein n=1 Tax=Mycena metata TaxID=1033252 RepID=A0AAD7MSK0_9AGAR|nr:hypothetical protein B0H16DRAFT_1469705 [Mycena metata]